MLLWFRPVSADGRFLVMMPGPFEMDTGLQAWVSTVEKLFLLLKSQRRHGPHLVLEQIKGRTMMSKLLG